MDLEFRRNAYPFQAAPRAPHLTLNRVIAGTQARADRTERGNGHHHRCSNKRRAFDEPQMTHLFAPIGGALAVEVELTGRRREHFAHPVGGQRGVRRVGKDRHPLPPPTGEVGYEDILAQMQLGSSMIHQPPGPPASW